MLEFPGLVWFPRAIWEFKKNIYVGFKVLYLGFLLSDFDENFGLFLVKVHIV